jgi:uncharacterized membrane protein
MVATTWQRAMAKSIIWKIISIVALVLVSWAAGASFEQTGKITIAYQLLTLFLYVVHERSWNKTSWGRIITDSENL